MTEEQKKGILVVSFGTTYNQVRKATIEACEDKIATNFPAYEVRRAFTSRIVRGILAERDGLVIDDTAAALLKMKEEGFQEVIIQPLHIIPGEEYHEKIIKEAAGFKGYFKGLVVGKPVLYSTPDYLQAVAALKAQILPLEEGTAVVLMGHGTSHPANACYGQLQLTLLDRMPGVYLANVEGYPQLPDIIPRLKERRAREVILMPYMLVAGEHAHKDMAGDEEDSWKSILKREGFAVQIYLKGLGENPAYQDIYVQHVRDCIGGEGR